MDSDLDDQCANPKRLKTLTSNVLDSGRNSLLHQFVLDNSDPNDSGSGSYINAVLLSMSEVSANALNEEGYSALHLAVLKNNILMVTKLLTCLVNIDINCARKYCGNTALHLSTKLGYLSIIQKLLEKGADLNVKNKWGKTPLCLAILLGKSAILEFLVNKGANVNAEDEDGETPLHYAVNRRVFENIKYLVSKGANVNAKDKDGVTPLHFAVWKGVFENIAFLISKGADVNAKDKDGVTPLHYAVNLRVFENIAFLISKGADVNAED